MNRKGSNFWGLFIKTTKKLFWEKSEMSKEEKESFIAGFKECKDGLLLGVTGANFAEGVDFPGDLLNGVIVIGLPLGKPDLKTKETIKYYDEKYKKRGTHTDTITGVKRKLGYSSLVQEDENISEEDFKKNS